MALLEQNEKMQRYFQGCQLESVYYDELADIVIGLIKGQKVNADALSIMYDKSSRFMIKIMIDSLTELSAGGDLEMFFRGKRKERVKPDRANDRELFDVDQREIFRSVISDVKKFTSEEFFQEAGQIYLRQAVLEIYDYYINVITADFCVSQHSHNLYSYAPWQDLEWSPFPFFFETEVFTDVRAFVPDVKPKIDLEDYWVFVANFEKKKFGTALVDVITAGLKPREDVKVYAFESIPMVYVSNGNHHVSVAGFQKQGSVQASGLISFRKVYDVIETDGVNWINRNTKESVRRVADYRMALLYEIARMKDQFIA